MTQLFNQKNHDNLRKILRKEMPKSERLLWSKLRANQTGYKFKRQFGIENYVVDFYCPRLRLVVEIDGRTHDYADQATYDQERQSYLENLKLKVIRFNSQEIFDNLDNVIERIWLICEELKKGKN
jgi:very-short-patch-repair endonuclease